MKNTILSIPNFQRVVNHKESRNTVSSIGIPFSLHVEIAKQFQKYGSPRKYLSRLLALYRILRGLGKIPNSEKMNSEYQLPGQNLQYFRFRPNCEDWFELKLVALEHGFSSSCFFVLLFQLDLSPLGELISEEVDVGLPTIPRFGVVRLEISLYKNKKIIKRKIQTGRNKTYLNHNTS